MSNIIINEIAWHDLVVWILSLLYMTEFRWDASYIRSPFDKKNFSFFLLTDLIYLWMWFITSYTTIRYTLLVVTCCYKTWHTSKCLYCELSRVNICPNCKIQDLIRMPVDSDPQIYLDPIERYALFTLGYSIFLNLLTTNVLEFLKYLKTVNICFILLGPYHFPLRY